MCVDWKVSRSFTVVELLVIIAITSIFCALLLPVLKSAMEESRRTFCANNLRQLGSSISAYMDFSNGWLPAQPLLGVSEFHPKNFSLNA